MGGDRQYTTIAIKVPLKTEPSAPMVGNVVLQKHLAEGPGLDGGVESRKTSWGKKHLL